VMMLSALVLKEFQTKNGQTVKWSKMLLPIKIGQFDLFRRLEAAAKKECGTMRGMYLVMARSKTDNKSPRIGEPVILENGKMFEMIPEAELEEEYGHDEVKGQDGKTVIRPADFDITPYDYVKLFPEPDVSGSKQNGPANGSTEEALREFEEGEQSGGEEQSAPSTRTRRRGTPDPEPEAPAAGSTRRRTKAASTKDNPFED